MTSKNVLPEKHLLEKATAIKKFEYLPFGSELTKQTDTAKTNLVYKYFNLKKFHISDEEFNELFHNTKYNHLKKFFNKINEFRKVKHMKEDKTEIKVIENNAVSKVKPRKEEIERTIIVNDTVSELYNEQIMKPDKNTMNIKCKKY